MDKTLNRQEGVLRAAVNYAAATVAVEYDPRQTSPEILRKAVQEAGYDLLTDTGAEAEDQAEKARRRRYRSLKQRTVWAAVLSLPVAVIGMFFMHMPYADYIMWVLSTPVVFWLGRGFFINAWKQLFQPSSSLSFFRWGRYPSRTGRPRRGNRACSFRTSFLHRAQRGQAPCGGG